VFGNLDLGSDLRSNQAIVSSNKATLYVIDENVFLFKINKFQSF